MTSPTPELTPYDENEAVSRLRQAILGGRHWYLALLEAVRLWTLAEEDYRGRHYRYLIAGEAFDWLLLAERLTEPVAGLIPEDEKVALLFYGRPPLDLNEAEFKRLIGEVKYEQHLNYFYGVTAEEALFLAVQDEVRKERRAAGYGGEADVSVEVYRRVYGTARGVLLNHFRREKGYADLKSIGLSELKEFTYWLFKYRLKHGEKARVASDTRKALVWLKKKVPGGQYRAPGDSLD